MIYIYVFYWDNQRLAVSLKQKSPFQFTGTGFFVVLLGVYFVFLNFRG